MLVTRVRHVALLEEALGLSARFDRCAAQVASEFQDEPVITGVSRAFLERHFDAPETVVLVAESESGRADLGLCLVGPFEDPLIGTRWPLVLLLYVDPAVRHRGVAASLIEEAWSILAGRGLAKLAARAGHNDDALISMGERWGFVRQWEFLLRE